MPLGLRQLWSLPAPSLQSSQRPLLLCVIPGQLSLNPYGGLISVASPTTINAKVVDDMYCSPSQLEN